MMQTLDRWCPPGSARIVAEAAACIATAMVALPALAMTSPLQAGAVSRIAPGSAENPSNVRRVESIVDARQFAAFFPLRATAYSYGNFLKAVGKYPDVCGDRTSEEDAMAVCRTTLATLFAHFAHETNAGEAWRLLPAWQQGLAAMRETGWDETRKDGYNSNCTDGSIAATRYPCAVFPDGGYKSYFGRGAFQLSWNFNYGALSESIYGTPRTLLEHPELVAESWLNFASATFFFTHSTNGRPSMQHVLDGTWTPSAADTAAGRVPGFGMTTWLINGALECGKGVESPQSGKRIGYYREFAKALSVPVPADEMLGCRDMQVPK